MLFQLLLTLAVVIALGQVIGRAFRAVGQPPVIGELIAGILLGPSLLGWMAPAAHALLLPPSLVPLLEVIAEVGVVLYMFLVGLELNPERLGGRLGATVAIAETGIVLPFALGLALAAFLSPHYAPAGVPFPSFALFVGVSLSVTAFPVLARILSDRGLTNTELGSLALTSAAIADVTAWCLLAFVVGVVQATAQSALGVVIAAVGFIAGMWIVVRPLVTRVAVRPAAGLSGAAAPALVFLAVAAAALVTKAIGVHAIFGAFMVGAIVPHDGRLAQVFHGRFERVVTRLLLPAFFALTGLRTEIGLVTTLRDWAAVAVVVLAATAGKVGGTYVAARFAGLAPRPSAALGVLMNTRGLMEVIVLNVGLSLGVITPQLFTILVMMALATTLATTPLMTVLAGRTETAGAMRAGGTGPAR